MAHLQTTSLKSNPYLKNNDQLPELKFNWNRRNLLLKCGTNWFFNPIIKIQYQNQLLINIIRNNDKYAFIDFFLNKQNGERAFEMRKNEWIIFAEISDLNCPPSNKEIFLSSESEGFRFKLRFEQTNGRKLREKFDSEVGQNILDSILMQISGIDQAKLMKSITSNNFAEKIKELEDIKKSLDIETSLTVLSFEYLSKNPLVHISNKSISVNKQKYVGDGNLFIDSELIVNL